MLPESLEYLLVLLLYGATGLALTWDGLLVAVRRRHFAPALLAFFGLCAVIEIIALNRDWWSFDHEQIVGLLIWRIPIEELLLFIIFGLITAACWETLTVERE